MTQKVFDYNIDTSVFNKYSINTVRISNIEVTNSNYSPINEFANIASVDNTGGYIVINGSGFAANAQVYYNVNTSLTVTSVTLTQIRAVVPAANNGNYNLYVQNPSGSTAFRLGLLKIDDPVQWISPTNLGVVTSNSQTSIFVTATSNSAVTYEFVSGSLPSNHYFNPSTGEITGNSQISIPFTTYSFTIRATDSEYQISDKLFNLSVANTVVFSISPAVSGKTTWILATDGPLSLTATTPYTIVPNCNAAVNVVMWGAGGGSSDFTGALARGGGGGFMRGHLKMYKSNTYTMTVAGGGAAGSSFTSGGGGGATGIETSTGSVLMVAGGGGGTWGEAGVAEYHTGGGGGGINGQRVAHPSFPNDWPNGSGGTQTAGGAGGNEFYDGFPGVYKAGGKGASPISVWPAAGGSGWAPGGAGGQGTTDNAGGGGGGGGYYGGGGGAALEYLGPAYATYSGWGGGGGSGYLHPTEVLNHASNTGGRHIVANTADTLRGTAGNGGASQGQAGSAGKIYITHVYTL